MSSVSPERRGRIDRRVVLHVALLTGLCLLTYFPGLDAQGVVNWQEAQRLIVARDMQSANGGAGEWFVPTVEGRPYLAKPPMVYWAQLAVAKVLGQRVELIHLRLVVALAGLAGVLATYAVTRRMLGADGSPVGLGSSRDDRDHWTDRAAFWSAAMLATGILYVRSSRIGELDILMVAPVVIAIGAVFEAWRSHRLERRTNIIAVALGAAAGIFGVLTKDPAIMVIGLGGYGGIALWTAFAREPLDAALIRSRGTAVPADPGRPRRAGMLIGSLVGALFGAQAVGEHVASPTDALGGLVIIAACAALGVMLARLCNPVRFMALITAMSRTHPLIVLGVPVAVRFGWAWLADQRIHAMGIGGNDSVAATLAKAEVEDNIRLFVPEAPLNNLEALAFGVGIGSVACAAGLVWLLRSRPKMRPGWVQVIAWLAFGMFAFSILGKGVGRYLTPLWPAAAMIGGMFVATLMADRRWQRGLTIGLAAVVVSLAIGQSVWYGVERGARSPRAIMAEVLTRMDAEGIERKRLCSFEFATPALDYYADRHVQVVGDPRVLGTMLGADPWTIEKLRSNVKKDGPAVLLARIEQLRGQEDDAFSAITRLRSAGLIAEELPLESRFVIDNGRMRVGAVKISIGEK